MILVYHESDGDSLHLISLSHLPSVLILPQESLKGPPEKRDADGQDDGILGHGFPPYDTKVS